MQTADLTLFFFPLSNYSSAASLGYFINCPNLNLHPLFHNWIFLLLILISECAFTRVVSSQHPSITRVIPLSPQTQLFPNSMVFPNFCVTAQSSPTGVRNKLHSVKQFDYSREFSLHLFTASDNLIVILTCIYKCQKDIFPVQEGGAM